MKKQQIEWLVAENKRLKSIYRPIKDNGKRSSPDKLCKEYAQAALIRSEIRSYYARHNNSIGNYTDSPEVTENSYVYILANPSFKELKIGFTSRDIHYRIMELDRSTSVPNKFELIGFIICDNAHKLEMKIHKALKAYRTNPKREFFNIDFEGAVKKIELAFDVTVVRKKIFSGGQ